MPTKVIRINEDTLEAVAQFAWENRLHSLSDAIDLLLCDAAPDIYEEFLSEDHPEE
jgi:predicted O-methyltransferase YrrM